MAVPKRHTSKSKRNKRRSHDRLTPVNLVPCPKCHELRPTHRVCLNCGSYKNREVIETK
ncbi:MAG TPA: 50S ribosomal protein L32 [Firmicutes bacterium]|nr:50S ribosomal protein L32 [Bacillota bacterium]